MSIASKLSFAAVAAASALASLAAHAVELSALADPGGPPNAIPEPGTWALVGLAVAAAALVSRKKRK